MIWWCGEWRKASGVDRAADTRYEEVLQSRCYDCHGRRYEYGVGMVHCQ